MSEILQSVSLLDDSGLANGCNSRLSGQNTSKSSRGAFNLKVESSRNGVLGQAGGGEIRGITKYFPNFLSLHHQTHNEYP